MLSVLMLCRSVRTRRFQTLSTQDLCQFLIVGVLSGLFWLQRAKNDTTAAASDTLGMSPAFQVIQSGALQSSHYYALNRFCWDASQHNCDKHSFRSAAADESVWLTAMIYLRQDDSCLSTGVSLIQHCPLMCSWLSFQGRLSWLTLGCGCAGLLFFEILFLSFRQLFVALFTFPDEFKMLLKERASGMYRLSAFYFARTASDLPMDMAIPTLFLVLVYFMGHLRYTAAAFFSNFFTVILVMLVSNVQSHAYWHKYDHSENALCCLSIPYMCLILHCVTYTDTCVPPAFINVAAVVNSDSGLKGTLYSRVCWPRLLVRASHMPKAITLKQVSLSCR